MNVVLFAYEGPYHSLLRIRSLLAAALILSACGGSGDNTAAPPEDVAGQGDTCDTVYYRQLRGNYEGQIEFTSPSAACAWIVDMQVSTQTQAAGMCFTFASLTSDLTSSDFGDSTLCRDIGISAQLYEPYLGEQRLDDLDSPSWPVDGNMNLNMALQSEAVFPVGRTGAVQMIMLRFNGLGSVTYPSSDNPDEQFFGVLMKQTDE